ncbi:MAG: M28 family peptidase [Dehalococcoidia bacterium]|nr:M28 family peptidase [Dehalococcoidia bacterium]MDW8119879.1 M28 family peptidase [Chloroflexota bacterium]
MQKRHRGLASLVLLGVLLLLVGACQRTTPPPTPTPLPTPTPTPAHTPVPSPTPASFPLGEQVLEWARRLVALSPRDTVSGRERQAAAFLQEALAQMGYAVRTQEFPVTLTHSEVVVLAPTPGTIENAHMLRSGEGEVEGEVVFVGLARREDLPAEGVRGRIALADRGSITFQEKAQAVAEAGAVALVVANNQPGLFQGALQHSAPLPVVSISQEEGQRLKGLLAQGTVRLRVRVWSQDYPSQNIIAERPGTPPGARVVLLTAHYDTVEGVPGANDNASGTGALLTLAQRLREHSFPFALRFIAFGGEEEGLFGSRFYVQSLSPEEREGILAVLNLDVIGSAVRLATAGDFALQQTVLDAGRQIGIAVAGINLRDAPSDHLPFIQAGIPAVLLTTPDFRLIHTPQDRLEFLDVENLENTVRVVEAVLQRLASGQRQSRLQPVALGARG